MFISFTLPRSLYLDETFVMVMGKDLSDSNTLVQKFNRQYHRHHTVVIINLVQADLHSYQPVAHSSR
jgi:hypothetical protein